MLYLSSSISHGIPPVKSMKRAELARRTVSHPSLTADLP